MQPTDLFVIGGGPAGLAAAIAARLKGLNVTLADGARPPIDKACGEGLMPDGLAALRSLGVKWDSPSAAFDSSTAASPSNPLSPKDMRSVSAGPFYIPRWWRSPPRPAFACCGARR